MKSAELPRKGAANLVSLPGFQMWLCGMVGVSLVFAFQSYYPNTIGPLSNLFPTACAFVAFLSPSHV